VKTGAEGVFGAAIPALGLGVAVKCDDGAARAAEVVTATVVARLLGRGDDPGSTRFRTPVIRDWNGETVGEIRAAPGWAERLGG
jgi:L-asparaginase II